MRTYKCYWATEIGEARLLNDVAPMITAKAFRRRRKRKADRHDKDLASIRVLNRLLYHNLKGMCTNLGSTQVVICLISPSYLDNIFV